MLNRAVNRSKNYILPAPIGGLNRRDALDNMPETDAIVMDNYYPAENYVELRGGYKIYALEGCDFETETLITFCAPNNKRIFAAGGGKIIDVTSGGDDVAVENLENNLWSYVQFRNRLLLVNGEDNPLTYKQDENEDWVWETTSLSGTGLNKQKLISVAVSKCFL